MDGRDRAALVVNDLGPEVMLLGTNGLPRAKLATSEAVTLLSLGDSTGALRLKADVRNDVPGITLFGPRPETPIRMSPYGPGVPRLRIAVSDTGSGLLLFDPQGKPRD